jgi:hypothetical protein
MHGALWITPSRDVGSDAISLLGIGPMVAAASTSSFRTASVGAQNGGSRRITTLKLFL